MQSVISVLFFHHFKYCLANNFYGMLVSALKSITLFNITLFLYTCNMCTLYVFSHNFINLAFFDKYFRFEYEIDREQKSRRRGIEGEGELIQSQHHSMQTINKMSNTYSFIYLFPSGGYTRTHMFLIQHCLCVRVHLSLSCHKIVH